MKTNRLQLAGIVQGEKGETGKTSYEYAVDKGYQGTEEEFSQAIKDTLDAREIVTQSKEEVLAAKQETLTAKESVDSSKREVLAAKESVDTSKNEVDQLNTQFETKATEALTQIQNKSNAAVSEIGSTKDTAISGIQQEGTSKTSKVTNAGNTAVGNVNTAKEEALSGIQQAGTTETKKVTDAGNTAVENITSSKDSALTSIQQEGTSQTSKVTESGTAAVGNINTTKDQALAQIQDKGSEILESIGTGAVDEVIGSFITADGTVEGSAIAKEIQGGTKQEKTNGYQLFDASKLPTKSAGGATVTNNGDGSFTVSGSGNITENMNYYYEFTREEALKLLKVGTLTLNTGNLSYPLVGVLIHSNGHFTELNSVNSENVSVEITQDMLNENDLTLRLRFYAALGRAIVPGTIKPMLYQDGDGTWEPFTGGAPSPNPDYTQEIEAIGGNGWFDGELTVGGYQFNTGKYFSSYENYYTDYNQDYISCKPGDTIRILTTNNMNNITAWFYRADKSFIKSISAFDDITVPAESAYFRWDIQKLSTSWPDYSSVGKVSILVNGKYAVKVNTCGRNLLSGVEPGCYVHDDGKKYPDSRYIRTVDLIEVETNKKYIVSYSGIKVDVSFLKYDENKKYLGNEMGSTLTIPSGCSYIALNFLVGSDVITNIQLEESVESTPYEPYKSSVSYIPLDSPLYEGDRIYLEDGELWEYRENGRVVFDGSENWFTDTGNRLYSQKNNMKRLIDYKASIICDRLVTSKNHANMVDENISGYADSTNLPNENWIYIKKSNITSVQELKTWLQSNPLEVVYKLATPTLKKLGSAEAFNLRTFDERTYIEVVGAAELNTQNTFIVPKNQLGGLATEAFTTSKQNAYKFEHMDEVIDAEDLHSYGFVEHMDILSPANRIEYVGLNKDYRPMSMDLEKHTTDYGSWGNFPSLVHNKPYMVKSTGEADYQLDENDYNMKATGGSSDVANLEYPGGAFSKFIKVYVKRWVEGNDRHVRFSYIPLEGYYPCGFIDTGGSEMDYVWLPMFYGSTVSGKMRSLSGLQPDINQTTATQNTNITAFSNRAAFFGGPIVETIKDMLYMLFKTTDIQQACGKGNSSGYNSAASPYYGVLPNAVVGGGQFYGSSDGESLNKIFHSIVLGSYQQYQRDPYYLVVNGRYKVSTDYTYDPTGEEYIDTGINSETVTASKWLYPHISKPVDGFGCIPVAPFSGSTATGYCDGVYHPQDKNFTSVVLRFGHCTNGSGAGLSCLSLDGSAADAYWSFSASVLLRPPVAT